MTKRQYRVMWTTANDKGVWETESLEQAKEVFLDYLDEGYVVTFQTLELRAYTTAPGLGESTVTKVKEAGRLGRPKGAKNKNPMKRYGL
jgi:hypothetical protein